MTTATWKKRGFIRPDGLTDSEWRKLYKKLLQRELRKEKPEMVARDNAVTRENRRKNKEERARKRKEYYLANLEENRRKAREKSKRLRNTPNAIKYRMENKDRALEAAYKWSRKNSHYASYARALRRAAIPKWADMEAIRQIYKTCNAYNARDEADFQVDHIIPIKGENVCGLHVESNLRIIPKALNMSKGNRMENDRNC